MLAPAGLGAIAAGIHDRTHEKSQKSRAAADCGIEPRNADFVLYEKDGEAFCNHDTKRDESRLK